MGVVSFLGSSSNAIQEFGDSGFDNAIVFVLFVSVVRVPDAHVLIALNTTSASQR